ncbi:MAG: tetratricopeptide repeat protein [Novosphingobium sp.]
MRYTPAAVALSLLVAVTASTSYSAPSQPVDPRVSALVAQGSTELAAGKIDEAIDYYEAALAVQPGNIAVLLGLADATRKQGMQGKALHYYRQALNADPQNLMAISGEGAALAEKGAVDKAKRNLTRLEGLCGAECPATRELAAAIAKGPAPKVVTADAVKPTPEVTAN